MKRILKILLITIAVIIIIGGLYAAWKYVIQPAQSSPSGNVVTPANIPGQNLAALSTQPVFDYWAKTDGTIYYLTPEGTLYLISNSGQEEKIGDQSITNLSKIKSSFDGSKAIISFGYPFKETFSVFNTNDQSWQPLPAGTTAAAWHPSNSNQIAILTANSLQNYDLNTKKSREIFKITQKDLDLEWVTQGEIYLMEKPSASISSSLWRVNINNKTITPIIKNKTGLIVKWADGKNLALKFISENRGGQLALIDKNGKEVAILPNPTLPQKCAFNQTKIYCAAPINFGETVMPDDYYLNRRIFSDFIYYVFQNPDIDFSANILNLPPIDAWNPQIKNNKLFFLNKIDKKIYSVEITE